jgi:hypothetical protein
LGLVEARVPTRFSLFVVLAGLALAGPADAVDGVIEINQARASAGGVTPGDTPGLPVTLSRSGSYRLTSSLLTSNRATTFVQITAPRVTLDLNGFTIGACVEAGLCATGSTGIGIQASFEDETTIRNGTVTGTGNTCISIGALARIESVQALRCGLDGIVAGSKSLVTDTVVSDGARTGIYVARRSLVRDSIVNDNGGYGLLLFDEGTLVVNTVISGNNGAILATAGGTARASGYQGCTITANNGALEAQAIVSEATGQILNMGHNVCGTDTVCP